MNKKIDQPIHRSNIRIALGKKYYRTKRLLTWFLDTSDLARPSEIHLDHIIFQHKTPLYRTLKNVDMWMQDHKVINLKIAINKLNGVILQPGEVFSYWRLIGKPTKGKGYVDGMILKQGKFYPGTGGGLCQLSNMIYWMILHSPLTLTERHRHGFDVFPDSNRTQPFGSGATCVYNYKDLQFTNNTHESYQLKFTMTENQLVGTLLSSQAAYLRYDVYESEHYFTQEVWGGYVRHNTIRKKIYNEDEEIDDVYVCENHGIMMYAPLLDQPQKSEEVL